VQVLLQVWQAVAGRQHCAAGGRGGAAGGEEYRGCSGKRCRTQQEGGMQAGRQVLRGGGTRWWQAGRRWQVQRMVVQKGKEKSRHGAGRKGGRGNPSQVEKQAGRQAGRPAVAGR